jgi:hypothetical protein
MTSCTPQCTKKMQMNKIIKDVNHHKPSKSAALRDLVCKEEFYTLPSFWRHIEFLFKRMRQTWLELIFRTLHNSAFKCQIWRQNLTNWNCARYNQRVAVLYCRLNVNWPVQVHIEYWWHSWIKDLQPDRSAWLNTSLAGGKHYKHVSNITIEKSSGLPQSTPLKTTN